MKHGVISPEGGEALTEAAAAADLVLDHLQQATQYAAQRARAVLRKSRCGRPVRQIAEDLSVSLGRSQQWMQAALRPEGAGLLTAHDQAGPGQRRTSAAPAAVRPFRRGVATQTGRVLWSHPDAAVAKETLPAGGGLVWVGGRVGNVVIDDRTSKTVGPLPALQPVAVTPATAVNLDEAGTPTGTPVRGANGPLRPRGERAGPGP